MIRRDSRRSIAIAALCAASLLVPAAANASIPPSSDATAGPAVGPNSVQAVGLGVNFGVFYPIVDGYFDTLTVEGDLEEPASDLITITSVATGKVVRQLYLPTTEGQFGVTWDGRAELSGPFSVASHGSPVPVGPIVPAGRYTVTQVVTNAAAEQLTVNSTTVVSHEMLHWYTGTITLNGVQTASRLTTDSVITANAPFAGWLRLMMPLGPEAGRLAAAGYSFNLPAAISYSAVTFSVLGSGIRPPNFGLQDFALGTWPKGWPWRPDDFQTQSLPKAYGWTSDHGFVISNVSGRTVRGIVIASNWAAGYYDIAKVRLAYRYSLLQ